MSGQHILIVEDQREVSRMLRAGLETLKAGLKVTDVLSGEEAMLVLSNQPVDLLIADIRLPGISGLELKRRAQQHSPRLKMILITGIPDPAIHRQAAEAGADAFFLKPVPMNEFLRKVAECLGIEEAAVSFPPSGIGQESMTTLPERLSRLRQEAEAVSVLLFDSDGQIIARAGDLPAQIEETALLPLLMSSLSAAQKVSLLLGKSAAENRFVFSGQDYSLLLIPVGERVALLLALPERSLDEQLSNLVSLASLAARELGSILIQMGVVIVPDDQGSALIEPTGEGESSAEVNSLLALEAVLSRASQAAPPPEEVDAFWATAAESEGAGQVFTTGSLSYDQARQLGLAPEDEQG